MLYETTPSKILFDVNKIANNHYSHIPTINDWANLLDMCTTIQACTHGTWSSTAVTSGDFSNLKRYLFLPYTGYIETTTGGYTTANCNYWTSEPVFYNNTNIRQAYRLYFRDDGAGYPISGSTVSVYGSNNALPVRLFSNIAIIPDNTWTTIYYHSSTGGGIYLDKANCWITITDGADNYITIEDRNVGATARRDGVSPLTNATAGNLFQWGNGYPFNRGTNYNRVQNYYIISTSGGFNSNGTFYGQAGSDQVPTSSGYQGVHDYLLDLFNQSNIRTKDFLTYKTVKKVMLGDEQVHPEVVVEGLCFEGTINNTSIYLSKTGTPSYTPTLEYTSNGGRDWYSWNLSNPITINNGQKLYIRSTDSTGTNALSSGSSDYWQFIITSAVKCSGDVTYLIKQGGGVSSLGGYCFYYLFGGTPILTPPELPSTTVASYCYYGMFQNCSALTSAPVLPATTLTGNNYCYSHMFSGCVNLITPPALPATITNTSWGTVSVNYAYEYMFSGCTSLEKIPLVKVSGTRTNAGLARYMFQGCTRIKMSSSSSSEYPNTYIPGSGTSTTSIGDSAFANTGGSYTSNMRIGRLYTANEVIP